MAMGGHGSIRFIMIHVEGDEVVPTFVMPDSVLFGFKFGRP